MVIQVSFVIFKKPKSAMNVWNIWPGVTLTKLR